MKYSCLLLLLLFVCFFPISAQPAGDIPESLKWSERMALSVMQRNPEPWMIDFNDEPKWNYTHGLVLHALERVWKDTGNDTYYQYAESYFDVMINEAGDVKTYDITEFNIDHITPGRALFTVYDQTGNPKYKKVLETLRRQLEWQPRTLDGGFWHKLRYPWQMWLDGAYMGSPFYAQYSKRNNRPEGFDDVARQLILMNKHLRDPETGLLYHGWDSSGLQRWSDPETGASPHFWGRAMGWYAMALVDVLDFLPAGHEERDELIDILRELIVALEKYQDGETGVWYQVVNLGDREDNYLEASSSVMYVYVMAKGVNEGYLDERYMAVAERGYEGILSEFIEVDEDDGEIHITNVCSVAGLGGDPYRSGSFEYYINEPVRADDPKASGPFILASLELGR